jgi:anti-anti-sigma factor
VTIQRDVDPTAAASFSFAIGRSGHSVVVTLHGELDQASSAPLERILRDLIDDQGNLAVVVDLRSISAADPSVLEVFLAASGWARSHRGSFRLYGPQANVAEALVGPWLAQELDIVP